MFIFIFIFVNVGIYKVDSSSANTPDRIQISPDNIHDLQLVEEIIIPDGYVKIGAWLPNRTIIVSALIDGEWGIWSINIDVPTDFEKIFVTESSHFVIHPTKSIVAIQDGCMVHFWDMDKREEITHYNLQTPDANDQQCFVWGMSFSQDGEVFSIVNQSGLWIWNTADHELLDLLVSESINMSDYAYFGQGLAFSSDGQTIAFADPFEDRFFLWEIGQNSSPTQIDGIYLGGEIRDIAFHPTENDILITANAYYDGIPVWNIVDQQVSIFLQGHSNNDGGMVDVEYTRDGTLIASSTVDDWLEFWIPDNSEPIHTIENISGNSSGFTFGYNSSNTLLAVFSTNSIGLWGIPAE